LHVLNLISNLACLISIISLGNIKLKLVLTILYYRCIACCTDDVDKDGYTQDGTVV